MSRWITCYTSIVGRIMIGGFFLWNGIQASLNFQATANAFVNLGLPAPLAFAAFAIALEVLCSILLIVDSHARVAALILALFVIFTAAVFTDFTNETQLAILMQNMAIVGGLLYFSSNA